MGMSLYWIEDIMRGDELLLDRGHYVWGRAHTGRMTLCVGMSFLLDRVHYVWG